MFPITALLPEPPRIKIVDIGAMSLGEGKEPYARLLKNVPCQIIGFEPIARECERLNLSARPGCTYLPHAVGDGTERNFYECEFAATTSLLEPNHELLAMFHDLPAVTRVAAVSRLRTVRLDDVPQAAGTDYLKLDVQGGELMVLQNATTILRDVLVLHTEVEFSPIYRDQPLFADIDAFLRGQGMVLHKISGTKGATFKLPGVEVELTGVTNQMMWGEAVYIRDFMKLGELSPQALLKLAVILHENYEAYDLVGVVLDAHDRKAGTDLADRYVACVFASPGEA